MAKKRLSIARESGSKRALAKSIAQSVDASSRLLEVLPELVADLQSLGSMPEVVCDLLEEAGCTKGWKVVDLGCGKGAVAVAAARRFGCRVVGIDGFEPFVEAARDLARRAKVGRLVSFRVGDVRTPPARPESDAALMIGLFGFAEAAPLLRQHVKAEGVYIIDDAVLARRDTRLGWPARKDAHECFAELGDELIAEVVPSLQDIRRLHAELETSLMFRATEIAQRKPHLREELEDFIARQVEAGRLLEARLRPVLWLVRKKRL